jgi:hypothetical protein
VGGKAQYACQADMRDLDAAVDVIAAARIPMLVICLSTTDKE